MTRKIQLAVGVTGLCSGATILLCLGFSVKIAQETAALRRSFDVDIAQFQLLSHSLWGELMRVSARAPPRSQRLRRAAIRAAAGLGPLDFLERQDPPSAPQTEYQSNLYDGLSNALNSMLSLGEKPASAETLSRDFVDPNELRRSQLRSRTNPVSENDIRSNFERQTVQRSGSGVFTSLRKGPSTGGDDYLNWEFGPDPLSLQPHQSQTAIGTGAEAPPVNWAPNPSRWVRPTPAAPAGYGNGYGNGPAPNTPPSTRSYGNNGYGPAPYEPEPYGQRNPYERQPYGQPDPYVPESQDPYGGTYRPVKSTTTTTTQAPTTTDSSTEVDIATVTVRVVTSAESSQSSGRTFTARPTTPSPLRSCDVCVCPSSSLCPSGLPGPRGANGVPGDDGADGVPGRNGPDSPDILPPAQRLVCSTCPMGITGEAGAPGRRGRRGPRGVGGRGGVDGRNGRFGASGESGDRGPEGNSGLRGPPGRPGMDGVQFTKMSGLKGAPGPEGPRGNPGVAGKVGKLGPEGFQGHFGPIGLRGRLAEDGLRGRAGPVGGAGKDGFYCPCPDRQKSAVVPADFADLGDPLNPEYSRYEYRA